MGYKTEHQKIYHLTCDICGKKENIVETDYDKEISWNRRLWSSLKLDYFVGIENRKCKGWGDRSRKSFTLCPDCTKKLKKLVKNVNFDKEW